ncbi:MAG: hypothetical protein IPK14_03285 [Blastocatellia bacterium]|nr:hypothetical protein [Blastocatellia bacterium]
MTQFSFESNNQGIITHCKNERKPPILRVWESLSKIPLAHMDRSYLTRVQTQLELCQDSDKEIWQFLICLLEYSLRAEFELKLKPIIDSAYVGDNKCLTELANLLNDNNEYIKQLASKVLANLENKRAIDELSADN